MYENSKPTRNPRWSSLVDNADTSSPLNAGSTTRAARRWAIGIAGAVVVGASLFKLPGTLGDSAHATSTLGAPAAMSASNNHQAWAHAVATHYRITPEAALIFVQHTARAAESASLELSLLLAVIGVESSFNPLAQSVMGAKGLMQVMPDVHAAQFARVGAAADPLDPVVSTTVGAAVLREYWDLCRGERVCALQRYNGALFDRTARYAQRVAEVEVALRATASVALSRPPAIRIT